MATYKQSEKVNTELKIHQNRFRQYSKIVQFDLLIQKERLLILKFLNDLQYLRRSNLLKLLDISSSQLENHLKSLIKEDLIHSEYQFLDSKPIKVISITPMGSIYYKHFKETILEFIFN